MRGPGFLVWLLVACSAGVETGDAARSAPAVELDAEARRLLALLPEAPPAERIAALTEIAASGDERWLAPLTDLLAFASTAEEWFRVLDTAGALTGTDLRDVERPWRRLTLGLAERMPAGLTGYAEFKGRLLARVDPRFQEFVHAGVATRVRLEEVVWGGVEVDGIPTLVHPDTVSAAEALFLDDDEPVFGVSLGGQQRAYPLRVLDWHEMANDVVGGQPVALAYCTLCGAGVLYSARLGERTFEFGSSGLLMRSNKLMFDRATRTLWNQLTGEPVVGPLSAERLRLEPLPLVLTTWGAWRRLHPRTDVVSPDTGYERDYTPGAAYGAYFGSADTMFPVRVADPGRAAKSQVFALRLGQRAKAYPLEAIARADGLVQDALGDEPVVVLGDASAVPVPLPPAWTERLRGLGLAVPATLADLGAEAALTLFRAAPEFARDLDAPRLLALPAPTRLALLDEFANGGERAPRLDARLRDEVAVRGLVAATRAFRRGDRVFTRGAEPDALVDQDGALWRVTEAALEGPDGARLERLPGHLVFWFGWEAFFPGGEVYR